MRIMIITTCPPTTTYPRPVVYFLYTFVCKHLLTFAFNRKNILVSKSSICFSSSFRLWQADPIFGHVVVCELWISRTTVHEGCWPDEPDQRFVSWSFLAWTYHKTVLFVLLFKLLFESFLLREMKRNRKFTTIEGKCFCPYTTSVDMLRCVLWDDLRIIGNYFIKRKIKIWKYKLELEFTRRLHFVSKMVNFCRWVLDIDT